MWTLKALCYIVCLTVIVCSSEGFSNTKQKVEKITLPRTSLKIMCGADLERQPFRRVQSNFRNEKMKNEEGYGVYYDDAIVKLSRPANKNKIDFLQIQYDLPPLFDWGNWASVRREFESVSDMNACKGIELELRVVVPSNAKLRITLSDVASPKDINKRGLDELWWFDLDDKLLAQKKGWIAVHAPFNKFYESYGAGTRQNDHRLDLSNIVAYEINLVSKGGFHPKGIISLKSVRTY